MANDRIRRTNRQLFIDALEYCAGSDNEFVSNQVVKDYLGWDSDKYDRIKEELADEEIILRSRGYSGRVGLSNPPGDDPLQIFVSYCHSDENAKNEILKHLEPLKRLSLIDTWTDRAIKAGTDWNQEILNKLENADIILLVVTINFINSNFCYEIELERALERHHEGAATVIPIIYRNCMWTSTPIGKLQALPKDGTPIASWPSEDDALVNVAQGIKKSVEDILADRE